ncbi:MAG: tetratricopeptide repeat protein [Sphingomonas bacterium]
MTIDSDISAALPEPPPPRPARRDAAIAEALRRFDGGEAGNRPRAATPVSWRRRIVRPQFAAFATVALVALISLPVWMSGDHQFGSVSPEAPASPVPGAVSTAVPGAVTNPAASGSVTRQVPVSPPRASTATSSSVSRQVEPAFPNPPSAVVAAGGDARGAAADAPIDGSFDPRRVEVRDKANLAGFSASESRPVEAKRLDKDVFARAENRAGLGYAAPPPPPAEAPPVIASMAPRAPTIAGRVAADASPEADIAVTGTRMSESSYGDVVVTGQRRSAAAKPAAYGNWNACTVDDPKQRLDACRKLVDPAAPGSANRAAARVADGLSRAWQDDLDGAISAFDQAIAISPRLSFAYLNRGLVYAHKGELDRALEDMNRAVRYAPDVARNYYGRSLLWRQRGDAKRAAADQARAIALDR